MSQNVPESTGSTAAPSGRPADDATSRPVPGRPRAGRTPTQLAGAVVAASAVGVVTVVASAWIAVGSAITVLFGGGLLVALVLVVLGVVLVLRPGRSRGWMVLPLVALAVPAVAVAASGARVERQRGVEVRSPRTLADVPAGGYRTGLGAQLVDLRHLALPAGRVSTIAARSDMDRTVVALPHDRCWNVEVRWRTGNLWLPGVDQGRHVEGFRDEAAIARWARRGRTSYTVPAYGRIALFGRLRGATSGVWTSTVADPRAPTLRLELRSEGSSFVVRDYPDGIPPLSTPEWPTGVEPPASPAELRTAWSSPRRSRAAARAWKRFRPVREAYVADAAKLMDGGCGRKVVQR